MCLESTYKVMYQPYYSLKNKTFEIQVVIRRCKSSCHRFDFVPDDKMDEFHIKLICKDHLLDRDEEKELRKIIAEIREEKKDFTSSLRSDTRINRRAISRMTQNLFCDLSR